MPNEMYAKKWQAEQNKLKEQNMSKVSEKFIFTDKDNEILTEQGEAVRSPLVGTFYAAPGAGAKPYVEVGSTVKEGDILCIIEAMKVMNEIHAPRAGVIKEIRAKDGDMVQFDEELMVIGD